MNDDTTPTLTDEAPPAVAPLHPELAATLAELDRDLSGELKFCQQAAASLRAFQVRWLTDYPVADGYGSAVLALENMTSILTGAQARATQAVTQQFLATDAEVQAAQTAQAARVHAITWAETPVPPPAPPDPPADPVLAYSPGV